MYFNHISIYSSTYKVTLDYLNHDLYVCTIALTFFLLCFVFYCCGLSAVFNELMMMMMMMMMMMANILGLVGISPQYVISHPGQRNLLTSVGWERVTVKLTVKNNSATALF